MILSECQKEIINYILMYYNNPDEIPIPNAKVFHLKFRKRYTKDEINLAIENLIENNILLEYSDYNYLDFTDAFRESEYYDEVLKS
ncbi:MAG: hypothetical protein BAJALOKI2v1_750010 [Promethearchaeota archaeon]|nr:MAG: hypothetical protein BAJALOKI2v1_750010 [Candidatus Lokiarchaeota archaeon]